MDARPLVLTGPNGAGKTNLLEAISYLSPGRGLRGARLADVARKPGPDTGPAEAWSVAATLAGDGAEPGEAERRVVRIEGATASGPAALAQHVGMVWLTPSMDRLFSGPPAERRRFLDRLVFAIDASHAARVQRYDRARRHRTQLLRTGTRDDAWLGALERSMAENAAAIGAARLDLAIRLEEFLPDGKQSFPRIALTADGLVERWLASAPALAAGTRVAEAEGGTVDGPQRSDLLVTDRERGMEAEQCSTGEQKAMLIALVTAHARLVERQRRCAPVLLLDEIAAHLDESRRHALFEIILDVGAQAWLTGTEPSVFRPLGEHAQFFTVRPGMVEGA
ncbi:DNA replication and repair protein RecF [Geodia barretti]|uniref:DNA replication and repair protein RecF n=1 Tax=Geodia barretti TaxID=519541 RepID=A0AA35U0F8_GEOBA|nr:DNA replication and repair protein RecF [Geodia barretti]